MAEPLVRPPRLDDPGEQSPGKKESCTSMRKFSFCLMSRITHLGNNKIRSNSCDFSLLNQIFGLSKDDSIESSSSSSNSVKEKEKWEKLEALDSQIKKLVIEKGEIVKSLDNSNTKTSNNSEPRPLFYK